MPYRPLAHLTSLLGILSIGGPRREAWLWLGGLNHTRAESVTDSTQLGSVQHRSSHSYEAIEEPNRVEIYSRENAAKLTPRPGLYSKLGEGTA